MLKEQVFRRHRPVSKKTKDILRKRRDLWPIGSLNNAICLVNTLRGREPLAAADDHLCVYRYQQLRNGRGGDEYLPTETLQIYDVQAANIGDTYMRVLTTQGSSKVKGAYIQFSEFIKWNLRTPWIVLSIHFSFCSLPILLASKLATKNTK